MVMFRLPALGLAEIAWRWSFGLALVVLLAFSFREYLATLPVTRGEILLMETRQPALIVQALARILNGSAPRAALAAAALTVALILAWIVLASLGRAASLKTLIEYFRGSCHGGLGRSLGALLVLNALRAAATLAAVVGIVGAIRLARAVSPADHPSPTAAILIFWLSTILIGSAWTLLNWYLSLAAIFVVGSGASASTALADATELCRFRIGSLTATGIWFGIAHLIVLFVATSAMAFPIGLAEVLPGGMILGGVLLVAMLYFAAVDFLYIGRLAAYVFMAEPSDPVAASGVSTPSPQSDDDILSDIPGLVPVTGN